MTHSAPPASEHVLTPFGARRAANAHEIPAGGVIRELVNETHLLDASGNTVHIAQHASESAIDRLNAPKDGAIPYPFAAQASYLADDSVTKIIASWRVPPHPIVWSGDTFFYYTSLGTDSINDEWHYLRAALQYGPSAAGGGRYWSIAAWHVTGGHAYYTATTKVLPGTDLTAVIASVPGTKRYITSIHSHAPGPLYALECEQRFQWPRAAVAIASGSGNLPESVPPVPVVFGPIAIGLSANTGSPPSKVDWSIAPIKTEDQARLSITIDKDGIDDSQITINCSN